MPYQYSTLYSATPLVKNIACIPWIQTSEVVVIITLIEVASGLTIFNMKIKKFL